ncbi:uncharacterized protein LOC110105587 [Dendrobium catenatum]|uniref:F-box protein n=1 Tax=Dendrobium catenatum TaxID=906689 RepID=A0A2I0VHB2_9ASPA|nr:uncharacterized protein LOC110105587 [Dendrobium catenatum]PKU62806.1 F-box protein [Dendrobium catenatum]
MQTRRAVRNSHIFSDGLLDGAVSSSKKANGYATIPISSPASLASPSSSSSFLPSGVNFIEHRVTKMDTLAGVAIKYGVEVADIKRINGLVTDLQMFAHKSLLIPLPGKHPPSPLMSNGSTQNGEKTPPRRSHYDILNSLQSLKSEPPPRRISPAMCSLQGFYDLTQPNKSILPEGTEMAINELGKTHLFEDKKLSESSISDPIFNRHRKSRSLVNVISLENGDVTEDNTESDKSIRRRQKADAIPSLHTPGILLKEESTVGTLSGRTGKGLALRPKPGSRIDLEAHHQNSSSVIDSLADVFVSVRKSSSTSNLTESENSFSIWPTSKWSLKPDAITRPIFDGLPKPITSWRNKAALD